MLPLDARPRRMPAPDELPGLRRVHDDPLEHPALSAAAVPEADARANTAVLQGVFYVLTGVWAIVGIRSFQFITGPKTDVWLVKTVGALVTAVGLTLYAAGRRRQQPSPEIAMLAIGSAASLAAIDVVYVARRRVSPVYLLDAFAELALIARWVAGRKRDRRTRRGR